MRSALLALALLTTSCAHAPAPLQEEERAEQIVARIMIDALAPESHGDRAHNWAAVSARVSRHMHWHLFGPDPRELEQGAVARRNGWISARGQSVGISAFGDRTNITHMTFELRDGQTLDYLAALRAAGAEVSFAADWEESSDYVLSAPGRESAELTSTRICRPPESRAGPSCHDELTLRLTLR
jgi:hypothetical protein